MTAHAAAGRVCLVTGASVGIGYEIVQVLLEHGMTVVGCARRPALITARDETHEERLYARKCDISQPSDIEELFCWIRATPALGRIDVCVINAGTTGSHTLLESPPDELKRMLDVNILGSCVSAQGAVKLMLEQGTENGHLIFINSMSGHAVHPHPLTRFYSATKFAMTALVEAWRAEIKDMADAAKGLRVSSISPRLVATEFPFHIYPKEPQKAQAILDSVKTLQPKDVADCVMHILQAPSHVEILDLHISPTQKKY